MLSAFAVAVVAAAPSVADWKLVADGEVKLYARKLPGERVAELRAETLMAASAVEVRAVLMDEGYCSKLPHVSEYLTFAHPTPTTSLKYTRLSLPLVSDRDYYVETTRESDLAPDGTGVLHISWRPCCVERPEESGAIRLRVNEGYWDIRAEGDAAHARVTYYLRMDPGGAVPAWIIDIGNRSVMPDVLRSLYDEVKRRRLVATGR